MSPRQHPEKLPAPTLAELQTRVDRWIGQFEEGYWPPLSMLARLTEEVGELARELNHHYGHKPKKQDEPAGEIALEVADIIFVLVCLCNSLQIDLGEAFERVMQKYDARDGARWTPRAAPPREGPAQGAPSRSVAPQAAPERVRRRSTPPRDAAPRAVTRRAVAPRAARSRHAGPSTPARSRRNRWRES